MMTAPQAQWQCAAGALTTREADTAPRHLLALHEYFTFSPFLSLLRTEIASKPTQFGAHPLTLERPSIITHDASRETFWAASQSALAFGEARSGKRMPSQLKAPRTP